MAPKDFKSRISAMRKNIQGARENLESGGGYQEIPGGTYVGYLTDCTPDFSKNDTANLITKFHITVGEFKGKSVRDYQHLENEVGIAIACQFLQAHGFDATPDDIFDLEKSEKEKRLCYSEDFMEACSEIAQWQPACQFRVEKRPSDDGQRMFTDVNVIEWIQGPGGSGNTSNSRTDQPDISEGSDNSASDPEPEKEQESEQDTALRALALKLGLDVTAEMSIDAVKEVFSGFEFPVEGVKPQQLIDKGYEAEDISDDSFINSEEADLLAESGLGEIVINPDPKYDEPKPAKPAKRRMMRRK